MFDFTAFLDKYFPLCPHPLKALADRQKRRDQDRHERDLERRDRRFIALQAIKDGENACLMRGSFITEEDMAQGRKELYSRSW